MSAPAPASSGGSEDGPPRNALLDAIQKGKGLKKVETVDKSSPVLAAPKGGPGMMR